MNRLINVTGEAAFFHLQRSYATTNFFQNNTSQLDSFIARIRTEPGNEAPAQNNACNCQ
jgi:hypothetical protein